MVRVNKKSQTNNPLEQAKNASIKFLYAFFPHCTATLRDLHNHASTNPARIKRDLGMIKGLSQYHYR